MRLDRLKQQPGPRPLLPAHPRLLPVLLSLWLALLPWW